MAVRLTRSVDDKSKSQGAPRAAELNHNPNFYFAPALGYGDDIDLLSLLLVFVARREPFTSATSRRA